MKTKRLTKKQVIAKAVKEAEKIFMKLNPEKADKLGNFPKIHTGAGRKYDNAAKKVEKQVIRARLSMWRENKKK